jgi:hypothetical protein
MPARASAATAMEDWRCAAACDIGLGMACNTYTIVVNALAELTAPLPITMRIQCRRDATSLMYLLLSYWVMRALKICMSLSLHLSQLSLRSTCKHYWLDITGNSFSLDVISKNRMRGCFQGLTTTVAVFHLCNVGSFLLSHPEPISMCQQQPAAVALVPLEPRLQHRLPRAFGSRHFQTVSMTTHLY